MPRRLLLPLLLVSLLTDCVTFQRVAWQMRKRYQSDAVHVLDARQFQAFHAFTLQTAVERSSERLKAEEFVLMVKSLMKVEQMTAQAIYGTKGFKASQSIEP